MADRGTTKAGKEGKGIIKNKKVGDEKQAMLALEECISGRRITFAKGTEGGETDFKGLMEEARNDIKKEIKQLKEEWGEKMKVLEARLDEIEKDLSKLHKKRCDGIGKRSMERGSRKCRRE